MQCDHQPDQEYLASLYDGSEGYYAVGKIAASYVYNYVEAYIDVFVVYIIVCTLAQIGFQLCEKHFERYRQSAQSVGK